MDGLIYALGIIGNIIALLMFLSPMKTFVHMIKRKSTENFKVTPYIATLLNTSLWIYYGLLMPVGGMLLVSISCVGAALNLVYVLLFISYTPKQSKIETSKRVAVLNIVFPVGVVLVTQLALKGQLRFRVTGFICSALAVGMYAAPLFIMRTVIKTKSVEYMPFLLSLCQFFNSGVWLAYAVLLSDYFLGVPNGIGFALGSTQLILYAIYKKRSIAEERIQGEKEEKEEDMSANKVVHTNKETKMKNQSLSNETKTDIEKGLC